MKYITGSKVKMGEEYFFVDDDFEYPTIHFPKIKKEKIYRIIDGEFSTRNDGDRYETIRHMAYRNYDDAKKRAVEDLRKYKKYINKKIDEASHQLTQEQLTTK